MSALKTFYDYVGIVYALVYPVVAAGPLSNITLPTPLNFVDPLIGTANGGHVFPGASLPFSMAKAGADVNAENQGGFSTDGVEGVYPVPSYTTEGNITGFSHMHDSGTGGSPSLGNFPIFPFASCPGDDIDKCDFAISTRATPRVNGSTEAHPGYFAVSMATGIHAEMTVTNHTALYRFTFPADSEHSSSPLILADLTDLPKSKLQASVTADNSTGRISGSGTFQPSFGEGSYELHFCADFSGLAVRDAGIWKATPSATQPAGAWTRFHPASSSSDGANDQILARVGVSFMSVAQACGNAEKEIPTFDFESVHTAAIDAWQSAMSPISITPGEGVADDYQTIFWSGIYRSMLSPQDYTGENPLWNSTEPYYDSYYCIWDSFRSIHSLITLIDPLSQVRMIRSLLDIYLHEGWLPDCRMSLCKGYTQGGSNADVLLSDLYVKMGDLAQDLGVNWTTVYAAVIQDAEVEPSNWDVEGRGGLRSWKSLGYIPIDDYDPDGHGTMTRSVSRTVEYAYNDFCVAILANALGHTEDYDKYLNRSGNWRNVYKTDQNSSINGVDTGFTGFLQPKYLNESWAYQDPIFCSPLLNFTSCYLNPDGHETYEGSEWLYSFFVPHDMASLITTMGGTATYVKRLDYLHESGVLYIGDEQGFLPVYQYHYAGRPGLSAARAHAYISSQFNNTLYGIPGNDDSGAMGSFLALSMMGIFPNPGQNIYFITPPFFEEISIHNAVTNRTATIRNVNFDAAYKNIYIQNATLNGTAYTRNWLGHDFFLEGGVLELTLGSEESEWGTRAEDVPPSVAP